MKQLCDIFVKNCDMYVARYLLHGVFSFVHLYLFHVFNCRRYYYMFLTKIYIYYITKMNSTKQTQL